MFALLHTSGLGRPMFGPQCLGSVHASIWHYTPFRPDVKVQTQTGWLQKSCSSQVPAHDPCKYGVVVAVTAVVECAAPGGRRRGLVPVP